MDSPLVITRGRRLTLAVGLPLSLAAIVLLALTLLARVSPVSTTIDTSAALRGTSLAVSVDAADLTFQASPDDRVHVSGVAVSSFAPARLEVTYSGSTTGLSLLCPPLPGSCSLHARIAVPARAGVLANVNSGTITASGLGGGATLSTDSADIQVRGLRGHLNLATRSGSVAGTGLRSSVTTVSDDSGDISLQFAAAPQRIQANDDSGDISLRVPRRAYQVSAGSDSGDTTVGVPQDPSSHNVISAHTDSGDIQIRP